jgi:hypothetical protein
MRNGRIVQCCQHGTKQTCQGCFHGRSAMPGVILGGGTVADDEKALGFVELDDDGFLEDQQHMPGISMVGTGAGLAIIEPAQVDVLGPQHGQPGIEVAHRP